MYLIEKFFYRNLDYSAFLFSKEGFGWREKGKL
jgi:hypothetical protein